MYFFLLDGMVRKRSQMQLAQSRSIGDFKPLKKSSSCSTIFIDDSTVSQPNLKNTIKCVSLAIYYHIKNRTASQVLDIFDEKLHPLTVRDYSKEIPNFCCNMPPPFLNNINIDRFQFWLANLRCLLLHGRRTRFRRCQCSLPNEIDMTLFRSSFQTFLHSRFSVRVWLQTTTSIIQNIVKSTSLFAHSSMQRS